jgi:hypothetical protein
MKEDDNGRDISTHEIDEKYMQNFSRTIWREEDT